VLPLVLATMAAQSLLVVLAPTMVAAGREFGTSVGTVGHARAIAAASAVAASLLIARLIDRVGLRRLMAAGACLAVLASAAIAAATSLSAFLAAHCVSGIAFACLLSAGLTGVGAFPRERSARAMGYVIAANALAWIVAGPLGGLLTDAVSWRAAHIVPIVLAFAALAAARRAAPLPVASAGPRTGLSGVLADRRARCWLVAELVAWFVWAGELTYGAAFLIQHHSSSEPVAGAAFAVAAAAFFCGSVRSARLVQRFARRRLIASAAVAMGALIPLQFCVAPSLWVTLGFLSLTALCSGVRTSTSAGLGLAQMPGRPGAIMTAQTAVSQLGYLSGALVGAGLLSSSSYPALGLTLGGGILVSAALFMRVADPERATVRQRRSNGLRRAWAQGAA
jgi:predicted MFS family arabinose efflux permease